MTPAEEVALKTSRTYGGSASSATNAPAGHNQFGMVIASCERADLRPLPTGVMVYDDTRAWLDAIDPPTIPRAEVIDEFCDAIAGTRAPIHTGEWAMATLEVCLAILESARTGDTVYLTHQIGLSADCA
jgi:phthalate 4,5-cis-dihydrodiol dehydrogenase